MGSHLARYLPGPRSPLTRTVTSRLAQLVLVLLGVSIMTFALLNVLPGDPAISSLGEDASVEAIETFRARHNLDDPWAQRFGSWVSGAVRGDLGDSYIDGRSVTDAVVRRLPVSLELVVAAQVLAIVPAILVALLAVLRRGTWIDRITNALAFGNLAIPDFLLSFILILIFAVTFKWFPATGFDRISDGLATNLQSIVLPAVALAARPYAIYMRILRSDMLETIEQDYVATASAKGVAWPIVMIRHVLRNSLLSLLTMVGVTTGSMLGGAVLVETIFAIPGFGRLLIESITRRDLVMVQGVVLFSATAYVLVNLVVDLLYAFLDPRIRLGHRSA